MKVAISTDTNSGITCVEAREAGLYLLPMPVNIEGETYLEGEDMNSALLYDAMRQHRAVSTSQPSPGQVMDLWDRILAEGYEEIVHIPMSSGLSSSCENAAQMADAYGGRVQVVDNHRISVTQRESVYSALRLAQNGAAAQEIKYRLEACAYDASIYIMVDSLDYLKKGGRITPAVATLATILHLKPVLTIQGDKLDVFAKSRGTVMAGKKMLEAIRRDRLERFASIPDSKLQFNVAGTLEDEERIQRWLRMVQSAFPDAQIEYVPLPCSIACHVGINSAGVSITKITS
ncbi:MAG: DegV family protein [Faecousia sp.]